MSARPRVAVAIWSMRVRPTTVLRRASERAEMRAPHPEAAESQPRVLGPALEDPGGEGGKQDGPGVADEGEGGEEEEDGADGAEGADVVPAFAHLLDHGELVEVAGEGLDVHGEERGDDEEVADAVDEEAPTFSKGGDDDACDGGAEEPCGVDHGGVDGDGVLEVRGVVDHLDEEGLAAGHVQRVDDALDGGEGDDLPQRDAVGEGEDGEGEGLEGACGLGPDEELAAVETYLPRRRRRGRGRRRGSGRRS